MPVLASVLGLGNILMGDDGFGPAVVRAFEETYEVGSDVRLFDLGTPGLDLTPWLADVDRVIIVDTIKVDLPPGSMRFYDKRELMRHVPTARVSPHDPGLSETLRMLEFAGRAPQHVTLVGVVPGRVAMGLEPSDAVRDAVPRAVGAIADALRAAGFPARSRSSFDLRPVVGWPASCLSQALDPWRSHESKAGASESAEPFRV
jgi:hydrogenase maturation protease